MVPSCFANKMKCLNGVCPMVCCGREMTPKVEYQIYQASAFDVKSIPSSDFVMLARTSRTEALLYPAMVWLSSILAGPNSLLPSWTYWTWSWRPIRNKCITTFHRLFPPCLSHSGNCNWHVTVLFMAEMCEWFCHLRPSCKRMLCGCSHCSININRLKSSKISLFCLMFSPIQLQCRAGKLLAFLITMTIMGVIQLTLTTDAHHGLYSKPLDQWKILWKILPS